MENKIRVCAYARVSTEKDDQANSFASQVQYFTAYINQQETWDLVKIYSDATDIIGLKQFQDAAKHHKNGIVQ